MCMHSENIAINAGKCHQLPKYPYHIENRGSLNLLAMLELLLEPGK